LTSKHEFHEHWLSDSRALPEGINEFLPVISIFVDQYGWYLTHKILS